MSYGTSLPEAFRMTGLYTARILKSAKPADLPVVQSTKFDFVINIPTARAAVSTGTEIIVFRAGDAGTIEDAFAALTRQRADALIVSPLSSRRVSTPRLEA